MTTSERNQELGKPRWNYDYQCYKDTDNVFLERGLYSIIVLAHGRPDVTKRSVLSTLDCVRGYSGEIEWIFIENGNDKSNLDFFDSLDLERKVVVRQKNYGINEGLNQGWAISRGEFVMIHENDWNASCSVDFLSIANDIFTEREDVGIIQLRDPFDPNENHGFGKPEYNPWSCSRDHVERSGFKLWKEKTSCGHEYDLAKYPNGFNNNPVLIRKTLYYACGPYPEPIIGSDPRHGETEYQERVARTKCSIAYIGLPIYRHAGRVQTQGV